MNKIFHALLLAVIVIAGCGDGTSTTNAKVGRIKGMVVDRDGPVKNGKLEVTDTNGNIVATTELKGKERFSVTIPGSTVYPVVIKVTPEEGDPLEAVVMDSLAENHDVTIMSTLVVESARNLGGIKKENMAQAAINAIRQNKKASGKGTSTGFKGDPTKQYGGWH